MTIQQLEYFLATIRHGSFTAAADALLLAQPSVSEQIRRLEAELGVALFTRAGRELKPTEAAEALRGHAERVLAEVAAGREAVSGVRELRGGTATFGMFGGARFYPIASIVGDFRRRYPGVRVRMVGVNSSEVAESIRRGDIDAGLLSLPVDDHELDVTPIMRDELVYVSSAPEAVAQPKTVEELFERPLVFADASYGNEDPLRRQLAVLAQREGRRLEPSIEIEDTEIAVDLAARGLADTVLARGVISGLGRRIPRKLGWVPFAQPIEDTIALVSRAGHTLSPASSEFVAFASAQLAEFARAIRTDPPRQRRPGA